MVVVLDCNIWISLTITNKFDLIITLTDKGIEIASCQTLRDELTEVLSRPKLSKFLDTQTIEKVVQFHDLTTQRYKLTSIPDVVSDEKDNYLFALCVKAAADYFITGDKLLLLEKSYNNTQIITLSNLNTLINNL